MTVNGQRFFPVADPVPNRPRFDGFAIPTGEFRPPKAGEWYISGALPAAYRAPNDLTTAYHIARLGAVVRLEHRYLLDDGSEVVKRIR